MKWINSGDIKNWTNGSHRDCAQTLPELVRRLILATADFNPIKKIEFPSGDSVVTGGWDGYLKLDYKSPFFPNGISGWEIGIDKSPGKKAEEDYKKRTSNSLGLPQNETTFVFVTTRPWSDRKKWEKEKRVTKVWKDVRVINVDDLEQWVNSAPAVALWLARKIGKVVSGNIRDIESYWQEWSSATDPAMTADLVIGGRNKEVNRINDWLKEKPGMLSMEGDSTDEAFAFLYSAINSLPEQEKIQALSRCVIVEDIGELRQLIQLPNNPLIIIVSSQCLDATGVAVEKGHHVFHSMDSKLADAGSGMRLSRLHGRLPRPYRKEIEKNLQQSGFTKSKAQKIARDVGRSIPVLRRNLHSSVIKIPSWANAESAKSLLPALFAGTWSDNKEGDRNIIQTLSGMEYDVFVKELKKLSSTEDSPIQKIGDIWTLKSPLDVWFLLARYVDKSFIELFKKSINAVLTKTDPKYDLPAQKQWAAAIYGKSNLYSEWLRTGLVESLVLLAVYSDCSPEIPSTQVFVDKVVSDIFESAKKWETWASLKDVTPLLAEASPDSFMNVTEEMIVKNKKLFQKLMQDGGGILGDCNHSGLLWALESIAWSSLYFSRTTSILAELTKIDKGGNWSNRAINSLGDIFLPGLPQTHATAEERLTVLDTLIKKFSKIVWEFTSGYFNTGSISESYRFRWRDDGGERQGLEPEKNTEYQEYIKGLQIIWKKLACKKENLINSMDNFTRFPLYIRDEIIVKLESIEVGDYSKEEIRELLENIREKLNWINDHGKGDICRHVVSLNKILEKLSPKDTLERVGWLLENPWPRLPEGGRRGDKVKDAQEKAAREVLDNVTLDEIIKFAKNIQYAGFFGHTLGKVIRDKKEDNKVLDVIIKKAKNNPAFVMSYARGRVETVGDDWVTNQTERLKVGDSYSSEVCALIHLGLLENADTWKAVSLCGEEAEKAYWNKASGYSQTDKTGDAAIAIKKLLDVKRPLKALKVAGDLKNSIPSLLLKRLIEEILLLDSKEKKHDTMFVYYLGNIFKQLYKQNELSTEEIARLEWPFASLFDDFRRDIPGHLSIHKVLQKDPLLFVQLVSFTYKRDDFTPDSSRSGINKEQLKNMARNASEVLSSWRLLPGLGGNGEFNEKELIKWVETVRKKCAEMNYVTGGDLQIAKALSHSPSDNNGVWPHTAVRNLIERLKNKVIERHIKIGLYNNRGVVSRGLNDGGEKERELAAKYKEMSEKVKIKWPRTAAMLRSIVATYEGEAKHEDIESDLNELRWS